MTTNLSVSENVVDGSWSTGIHVSANNQGIVLVYLDNAVTGANNGVELQDVQGVVVQENTVNLQSLWIFASVTVRHRSSLAIR